MYYVLIDKYITCLFRYKETGKTYDQTYTSHIFTLHTYIYGKYNIFKHVFRNI